MRIMPMTAGHEGIARGQTMHKTILNQKIESPIDLHRGRALARDFRHAVNHLIGPHGATGCAKLIQHNTPRRG